MKQADLSFAGRLATRLATWFAPSYKDRSILSNMNMLGYISPDAVVNVHPDDLNFEGNVFVGDRCVFHQNNNPEKNGVSGGLIKLGKRVQLYSDIIIEIGCGGEVVIGEDTHIQPRCQLMAYVGNLEIGRRVEIAPNCSFYTYNHGVEADTPVREQPCYTKGGIRISDDVWLGVGVIVLDGVQIGKGAVIGAGSVVTTSIPEGAIAFGNPARVLKFRVSRDGQETAVK